MAKTKFEALIEHIINDEQDAAKELFHDIVVEKSRQIYNDLVAENEEDFDMGADQTDDMADDIDADEAGMDADEMGDDAAELGDEMGVDGDEMGDDLGGEDELEDRVVDLEAALDELKAEFDSLMGDEEGEAEHDFGGDDMGSDDDMGDDMDADFGDDDMEAEEPMPEGMVREYVEKVKDFYKGDNSEGSMVGSDSSSKPTINAKSIVAGKNDMGGTTANIAKGGSNNAPDGNSPPKAPSNAYKTNSASEIDVAKRNVNVPGGKGASNFYNGKPKAKTGEESGTNDKSIIK